MDSYSFEAIDAFRSLELPRLLGEPVEFSELSDLCARWEDFGAFRLPKNDFDVSRLCFGESLGEGKYWGMAVRPGVVGSAAESAAEGPGEVGAAGLRAVWLES